MGVRILSDSTCLRCGISEDDPRAQQACASMDSPSPYHRFHKEGATMKKVCAWCKSVMQDGPEQPVSHGLCQNCADEL